MKKAWIAVLGLAASAMALPVAAQSRAPSLSSAYVGASIGQSDFKGGCDDLGGLGVSCDNKDTAWRIFAGYQLNRNFAVEAGYHALGEAKITGPGGEAKAEASAFELVGVGALPLGNAFSVYGKLGLYYGMVEASAPGFSSDDNNTGLTYGVGAQFDVARNLGLRLEWQRYHDMGSDDSVSGNLDVLSFGILYRFQ